MISKTLMKQTVKSNLTLWLILTAIQAAMVALVAGTGANLQVTALAYYNMLPELITSIYVIITANKLIAAQVDKGTMAYILSTPVKRSKVVATQAVFFLGSLLLMFSLSAASHILSHYISAGNIGASEAGHILLLNLGLFFLNVAISGVCFCASCLFNLSKYAVGLGGGITGAFVVLSIMGMFGKDFQWMKNLTVVTLFDINSIFANDPAFVWKFALLAVIGAVAYAIGSVAFTKRDLPL
jgi:hypothetical protein